MRALTSLVLILSLSMTQGQHSSDKVTEAWNDFKLEKPNTVFTWKSNSPFPHSVICDPIALAESITDEEQLETLLLDFVNQHTELFGMTSSELLVRSIHRARNIWYAEFAQVHHGIELLDSEMKFRVHLNGNLFVMGMDLYQGVELNDSPSMSNVDVKEAFLENNQLNPMDCVIELFSEKPYIITIQKGEARQFKEIYLISSKTITGETDIYMVDGQNGDKLRTVTKSHDGNAEGTVSGDILPTLSTDAQGLEGLPHLGLQVDGQAIYTDADGNFSADFAGSEALLTAQLKGLYADVQHFNQGGALFETMIQDGNELALVWDDSNSDISERNVYYHINLHHDYNKTIDPNFVGLDYPLNIIVNDNQATCNAYWNGQALHFNTVGPGCAMNSAHGASVIYHEYGHAINDHLYIQAGQPLGLRNPTLQEAFSDIYSCLLLDESLFAMGWTGPGTGTRNLNNNNSYPSSLVGQQHSDGLILGGAFWDLGLLTSPELAYELSHYAKYGTPDDDNLGIAFSEVYIETLIADENDGNLLNGTPNSDAIEAAFCLHGIGSDLYSIEQIVHEPLPNTLSLSVDYPVEFSIPNSSFLSQSAEDLLLIYSTDDFESSTEAAVQASTENNFIASIPSQPEGTLVKYYFKLPNGTCGTSLLYPSSDFLHENYSFYVGDYIEVFADDFETDQNWNIGASGDDATSGIWQRSNPQQVIDGIGFELQPEDDHSENGSLCMVTGATVGQFWYSNDVDGGSTTITSPIINDLNQTSILEFYKWFVHGAGFVFPAQGSWKAQASSDGISWVTLENTNFGEHRRWIRSQYRLSDYLDVNSTMQIRFIASDLPPGSIVEALVDDVRIVSLDSSVGIEEANISEQISINLSPIPATTSIDIQVRLAESSDIHFSIFSLAGTLLSRFHSGIIAREHSIHWERKESMENGMYLLKVQTDKGNSTTYKFILK